MMPVLQQGIHDALYGNPEEEAKRQAEEAARAAEQKRRADEQARRAEETKERLLGTLMDSGSSPELKLMGVAPSPELKLMTEDPMVDASFTRPNETNTKANNTKPKSGAYTKGFEDAGQCYSPNAGPYCLGAGADQQPACVSDYRAGFELGDKQRELVMQEAYQAGQHAGASGGLADGASDARAKGSCRTQWVEAYNRGYFQGKEAKAQR